MTTWVAEERAEHEAKSKVATTKRDHTPTGRQITEAHTRIGLDRRAR